MYSTVVNVDMLDLLRRTTRLTIFENGPPDSSNFFKRDSKKHELFVPQSFSSNAGIEIIVFRGFEKVIGCLGVWAKVEPRKLAFDPMTETNTNEFRASHR